ncbi:hypothetical protein DERF_011553 [Dermatophagoides farinae]|uniref:Uncharacterized protein n=1 Tax=Dermatophagoides farinae TaxID=6954 RepID=A0A922HSE9_DERFA|nr:hypothetical protein DERF_011553 [Dermatophagoides farinae]
MENRKIENSSSKFQILKPSISSFDADDDMDGSNNVLYVVHYALDKFFSESPCACVDHRESVTQNDENEGKKPIEFV